MSDMIALHRLAASRGDGLHPKLLDLLAHREALIEGNPGIVEINATQSGPNPTGAVPDFLPGNVVGFRPKPTVAASQPKASLK
ncbi:hypothetical protein [Mesorhizobium sp. CAU 1732]|uniref:hypothetical protein n=1 Tax=Mesorhizobium sp. CAU 1732 TaxID=3140358 RepID=UPI0032609DAD